MVSWIFSTEPPLPAPRMSAIFCLMLARYPGSCCARPDISRQTPHPATPSTANTSATVTSTAGPRPNQRSSRVTGGPSTKVRSDAKAMGTRTAWAAYRTTTTSTQPANVTQGPIDFGVSTAAILATSSGKEQRAPLLSMRKAGP